MVVVINGTMGVGKTWVARTLFSQLEKAFCIDGDALGFISSDLVTSISRQEVICQAAAHQIELYRKLGVENFVFDNMFLDPILLKSFISSLNDTYKVFYLTAADNIRNERIEKRGRPQAKSEFDQSRKYLEMQQPYLSSGQLGQVIDTSSSSVEEIVDQLLQAMPELNIRF